VGAIFVGSMQTVWQGQITPPYTKKVQHFDYQNQNIRLKKGEEMGIVTIKPICYQG
jgi:phosphatidylserine decarboxylase